MPLGTLDALTERLLAHGVEPERPAWAVFNATRPQERVIGGTLATIRGLIQAARTTGPCLLLLGRALRPVAQAERDWPQSTGAPGKPGTAHG